MRNREHFSEQIRLWRIGKGLTRTELAKYLGYSETSISRWKRGVEISEYEVEDICAFFGIEVYD